MVLQEEVDLSSYSGERGKRMQNSEKLVVLFDGSCHFCTATVELLGILDWQHHLHCLPFQAPGIPQAYGLTVAQCEQAVWSISADGSNSQGAQAVSAVLDTIVGLPLFRILYQLPGISRIEDKVYGWVANHRQWFPGIRPYCQRPGALCGA
jgi:predicted DCC family thiol-disulfide oxidoreductase YuxK